MGAYITRINTAITSDVVETQTISGTSMTLANTPSFTYGIFRNGVRQTLTADYTISGATITFVETMDLDSITAVYKY